MLRRWSLCSLLMVWPVLRVRCRLRVLRRLLSIPMSMRRILLLWWLLTLLLILCPVSGRVVILIIVVLRLQIPLALPRSPLLVLWVRSLRIRCVFIIRRISVIRAVRSLRNLLLSMTMVRTFRILRRWMRLLRDLWVS